MFQAHTHTRVGRTRRLFALLFGWRERQMARHHIRHPAGKSQQSGAAERFKTSGENHVSENPGVLGSLSVARPFILGGTFRKMSLRPKCSEMLMTPVRCDLPCRGTYPMNNPVSVGFPAPFPGDCRHAALQQNPHSCFKLIAKHRSLCRSENPRCSRTRLVERAVFY